MGIYKGLAGLIEAELTSADLESAYASINEARIPLFSVRQESDLTARFTIYRKDYILLERLAQKRGEELKLCARKGFYWTIINITRRPVILLGAVLFLFLMLYLPSRVLFIRVEGNSAVPTRRILEAAEESGIRFGASRERVRSEHAKNELLSKVEQLKWAGVNTYGCVAVISVREGELPAPKSSAEAGSIVAVRDGIIYDCTATRGTPLCSVGQAVMEGQTLISGYTDCGIAILTTRAEGEVYAQTSRHYKAAVPSESMHRVKITKAERRYSLILGKNRINLWKGSGICQGSCGRMYEEYYITLPGGFILPIALAVEEITFFDYTVQEDGSQEEWLSEFAGNYLVQLMTAGKILQSSETVEMSDGVWLLEGDYVCQEMIGRFQSEQIGDYNGKND